MNVKERTDLEERSDTYKLSEQELDLVSGGFLAMGVLRGPLTRRDTDTGGGKNDPAQMFQQIMQQLTQGQS